MVGLSFTLRSMHTRRLVKQILYAGTFLGAVSIFVVGLIIVIKGPSVPEITLSSDPQSFAPINLLDVSFVAHAATVDVVARLHNPNPRAGVEEYPVTFVLFDAAGGELARRTEITYLLPGSLQYVVALSVPVAGLVNSIEAQLPEQPNFVALPSTLTLPTFGTLLQDRQQIQRGPTTIEQQVGLVTNNSTFDFQRVEVVVIGLDEAGKAVGVGKTFIGELRVGEQRQFTVSWPFGKQLSRQVVLLAATNIFKEENILQVIGDPSLLR